MTGQWTLNSDAAIINGQLLMLFQPRVFMLIYFLCACVSGTSRRRASSRRRRAATESALSTRRSWSTACGSRTECTRCSRSDRTPTSASPSTCRADDCSSACNTRLYIQRHDTPRSSVLKLKFYRTDTDTDTDFLADFRARILADLSADTRAFR